MAEATVESWRRHDNDVCTNCGQARSDHTAVDYLCPSDFNDGDDDMSFSTLKLFNHQADKRAKG